VFADDPLYNNGMRELFFALYRNPDYRSLIHASLAEVLINKFSTFTEGKLEIGNNPLSAIKKFIIVNNNLQRKWF
jgi:hypothetical protein